VDGRLGPVADHSLSPPDAIVALRSLPRRFRAAATPNPDDGPVPDAVRVALGAAGTAAAQLDAIGDQLRQVLVHDSPALAAPPAPAPGDPATALDRLTVAATTLADLAERQDASAWARTGRRGGATETAADLLRDAVRAAIEQLRVAERAWGDRRDEDDAEE
jgi:hypothetical protein